MVVNIAIDGLKKGTVYLQKIENDSLVSIDSVTIRNDKNFQLAANIESPQIFFITLKEVPTEKIQFFGDLGIINITSKLNHLATSATITGSKAQDVLAKYNIISKKFNDKRLDYIKENFEAKKAKDTLEIQKLDTDYTNLIKRRYLYTANFAVKNGDSEVAPYLALTELYETNTRLLDTVYNSLTPKVKTSLYGKKLDTYIKNIKAEEVK